jgi:hypothetical protein
VEKLKEKEKKKEEQNEKRKERDTIEKMDNTTGLP